MDARKEREDGGTVFREKFRWWNSRNYWRRATGFFPWFRISRVASWPTYSSRACYQTVRYSHGSCWITRERTSAIDREVGVTRQVLVQPFQWWRTVRVSPCLSWVTSLYLGSGHQKWTKVQSPSGKNARSLFFSVCCVFRSCSRRGSMLRPICK